LRHFHVILISFAVALTANVFIFRNYTNLSEVAAYSVFINCFTVLTMVPVHSLILLRDRLLHQQMPMRVKNSMKAVAGFALLSGLAIFMLFSTMGEYLIAERMALLGDMLESSDLSPDEQRQRLESAARIYSPAIQVLFSVIAVMFTGFISALVAGIAVRPK